MPIEIEEEITLFGKNCSYTDIITMKREGKYINLKKNTDDKKYFRYDMQEKQFERFNFYKTVENKATPVSVRNITGWFNNAKIVTTDKKFAKLVFFNKYHWDFSSYRNPVRFIEMLGNEKNRYLEEWESLGIKFKDVEDWYERLKEYYNERTYWYIRHSTRISYPPSVVSKELLKYIKNKNEITTSQLNELVENYNNGEYKIINKLIDMEKTIKYSNIFDDEIYYGNQIVNMLTSDDYRARRLRNNISKTIMEFHLDLESFCEWIKYQKSVEKNSISYIVDHYNDYLRMELALNNGSRSKITKYPKHFRDIRQRTIVEYKAIQEQISERMFKEVVENNRNLEYQTKKYSIVLPETSKDIEEEANELKHCVRSYIKPMSRNETLICFCRFTKNKSMPLVTIEVKKGAVTQAYTKNDKKPKDEQLRFIEKWADKKNLTIAWCW